MMNHNEWLDVPYDVDPEYVHVSELEELEENIEQAREFLVEAFKGLYGDKSLDHMERALEEVCAYLRVPFPKQELKVTKENESPMYYENPYFQIGAIMSKGQARVLNRTKHE